jgi:hypothetical protein
MLNVVGRIVLPDVERCVQTPAIAVNCLTWAGQQERHQVRRVGDRERRPLASGISRLIFQRRSNRT